MRTMHTSVTLKGWLQALGAVLLSATLVACGGGGGSDSGSGGGNSSDPLNGGTLPPSPTLQPSAVNNTNAVAVTVGRGASGVINIPSVSVTICAPGSTTNCQTINNIQLDTGSFGLRVVGSVLNSSLAGALPVSTLPGGAQLAQCATFADGFTWGTVRTATVTIGGETTTSAIPLQIIGDKAAGTVPSACGSGAPENTVADLGANGILGVGTAPTDCGATCANPSTAANYSNYYACPNGTSCTRTAVPLAQQVANPVASFPVDNNGVIVQMPPVSNLGQASATGTLVFGIGTQANNALDPSQTQILATDAYGNLNRSVFKGTTVQAFLDSGSNGYFFTDSTLTQCGGAFAGFYCPASAQTRTLTLHGEDSVTKSASIGILSAQTLFNNGNNYAFNNLAGQLGGNSFDLGLPFFYGRHVYYHLDQTASGGAAPFVGY
ncbi:DUF3443 domain-containing protein [Paraburkholderia sp. MMS20-SJTR3]|uniref:DUF3443 domain-containing protein n=1 Tax=Paraburkholderia sejongensis TaxID=2886946 RepID=A0ABS8JTI7_9BURK|nr:DUF3443 domain-containing protein [Paraburkholderia sp. MMS20-SJTR3]MCC8393221.1 DUF3443 domain-containing protein [Paraburkholderia sp. MMS20-SJTR3]